MSPLRVISGRTKDSEALGVLLAKAAALTGGKAHHCGGHAKVWTELPGNYEKE